jgi:hypothetical protein
MAGVAHGAVIERSDRPRSMPPLMDQIDDYRADEQHTYKAKPDHKIGEQRDQDHNRDHNQRRPQKKDSEDLDHGRAGSARTRGIKDRPPQSERRSRGAIRPNDFGVFESLGVRRPFLGHGLIMVGGGSARPRARRSVPT